MRDGWRGCSPVQLFKQENVSVEELSADSCPEEIWCTQDKYLLEKRSFEGKDTLHRDSLTLNHFDIVSETTYSCDTVGCQP